MTLIEIMIVVTIMGMIAAAVGVSVMNAKTEADLRIAKTELKTLANVAEAYVMTRHEGCPSLLQLRDSHLLARGSTGEDPWGNEYAITCGDEVNVHSAGPDGERDTEDDLSLF